MSDKIAERSEMIRSTIITTVLTSIFLIIALIFWAWANSEVSTPLTNLNEINTFIAPVLEIVFMGFMFFFMTVTVINLRLYLTRIRSGWLEIILLLCLQMVISYLMFGLEVTGFGLVLCLGFIAYIYLLQD